MIVDNIVIYIVYYDGVCLLCCGEMELLMQCNCVGLLVFVDISVLGFDLVFLGVSLSVMFELMYVCYCDGVWLIGILVFEVIYVVIGFEGVVCWLCWFWVVCFVVYVYFWLVCYCYWLFYVLVQGFFWLQQCSCWVDGVCYMY